MEARNLLFGCGSSVLLGGRSPLLGGGSLLGLLCDGMKVRAFRAPFFLCRLACGFWCCCGFFIPLMMELRAIIMNNHSVTPPALTWFEYYGKATS